MVAFSLQLWYTRIRKATVGGIIGMLKTDYYNELKKCEVLEHYGNGKIACVNCGFEDIRALTIDHVYNDGARHRGKIGGGGRVLYKWLIDNGYPEGFQTLCMNCQWIKKYSEKYGFKQGRKYTDKVRRWIDMTETRFHTNEIKKYLDLNEKDSHNLKYLIQRMVKKGEIVKVGRHPGCYKKIKQPVSVSAYVNSK